MKLGRIQGRSEIAEAAETETLNESHKAVGHNHGCDMLLAQVILYPDDPPEFVKGPAVGFAGPHEQAVKGVQMFNV